LASSSLEWLPAGELPGSDVPGGENSQQRYLLVATLSDEIGEVGEKSITPTRREEPKTPAVTPSYQGEEGS